MPIAIPRCSNEEVPKTLGCTVRIGICTHDFNLAWKDGQHFSGSLTGLTSGGSVTIDLVDSGPIGSTPILTPTIDIPDCQHIPFQNTTATCHPYTVTRGAPTASPECCPSEPGPSHGISIHIDTIPRVAAVPPHVPVCEVPRPDNCPCVPPTAGPGKPAPGGLLWPGGASRGFAAGLPDIVGGGGWFGSDNPARCCEKPGGPGGGGSDGGGGGQGQCGGGGGGLWGKFPPSYSYCPVRYATGEVFHRAVDVVSNGYGVPWGHRRSFASRLSSNESVGNGYNWQVEEWPMLARDLDGNVAILGRANGPMWFRKSVLSVTKILPLRSEKMAE